MPVPHAPLARVAATLDLDQDDLWERPICPASYTVTETRRGKEPVMGKGILLWLLGIPIPIIILLLIFWH
jgi:hypothetical protein